MQKIEAKSLLRKLKTIESWFITRYGMNIYRGCSHNCAYCDGRAEKYHTESDFGQFIEIKTNAIELLQKELDPHNRRKSLSKTYIMISGGVGDAYQPVEKEMQLTSRILDVLIEYQWPVHILTKSSLAIRDMEKITTIHQQSGALLSTSLSTVDDTIGKILEPGATLPSQRLSMLTHFKKRGIPCGVYLLPIVPGITDSKNQLEKAVSSIKQAGADYIIFGGMTLKPGRQQKYFYQMLQLHFPHLIPYYDSLYSDNRWGNAKSEYYQSLSSTLFQLTRLHQIPPRIPAQLFNHLLNENDLVQVILPEFET